MCFEISYVKSSKSTCHVTPRLVQNYSIAGDETTNACLLDKHVLVQMWMQYGARKTWGTMLWSHAAWRHQSRPNRPLCNLEKFCCHKFTPVPESGVASQKYDRSKIATEQAQSAIYVSFCRPRFEIRSSSVLSAPFQQRQQQQDAAIAAVQASLAAPSEEVAAAAPPGELGSAPHPVAALSSGSWRAAGSCEATGEGECSSDDEPYEPLLPEPAPHPVSAITPQHNDQSEASYAWPLLLVRDLRLVHLDAIMLDVQTYMRDDGELILLHDGGSNCSSA